MPLFSIIIPVKPGGYVAACEQLNRVMPDEPWYEILLAEGNAPSQQRNGAARAATGEILYFLDDDSLATADNFTRCAAAMGDSSVAVVGGPSLTPPGDSWLQQLFGAALASPFGSGGVRNRYRRYGALRATTDKELILCNLAIRRSHFIELGGFNERLYPNEENEFMERVVIAGHRLLHDPAMCIERSQRSTLKAFVRQMFAYGRGRGEQTLLTGSWSLVSFVPLIFDLYLIMLLLGILSSPLLFVPLAAYLIVDTVSTILELLRSRRLSSLLLIGIFPLMHCVNGLGLVLGLLRGVPPPRHDSDIRIRWVKRFNEGFAEQADTVKAVSR